MKKLTGAGRKPAGPSRSNTTSSIRGKISAPIPISTNDDEFPIRTPGTGIAMPLGHESLEKEPRAAPNPLQVESSKEEEANTPAPDEEPSRAAPSIPQSMAASLEDPAPPAMEDNSLRGSGVSNPSRSTAEKPQRKKSTLRTVLGRLFGKKRKSGSSASGLHEASPRAGLHRSASVKSNKSLAPCLLVDRILQHFESQAAKPYHLNVRRQCQSMIITEP